MKVVERNNKTNKFLLFHSLKSQSTFRPTIFSVFFRFPLILQEWGSPDLTHFKPRTHRQGYRQPLLDNSAYINGLLRLSD